jgi:methylenetetrahydrofolate dehydrogenase (NADP+) / methenyltetrahydrofolate cyclohydrolase
MGTLREIVFDCHSAPDLARFWAGVLNNYALRAYDETEIARLAALGLTPDTDPTVLIDGPGPSLCFQHVPRRPEPHGRVHVDVLVGDREQEASRLCALGASLVRTSDHYTVLADPEGNRFCVVDAETPPAGAPPVTAPFLGMLEAKRLDGKALAGVLEAELRPRVERLRVAHGCTPILATLLVGDDPASATYVKMKGNACRRAGMESRRLQLPASSSTEDVLAVIDGLNVDPEVHGILLQHPVPKQVDERACFDRIHIDKDVDGVTAHGFGRLAMGERAFGSATPAGILRLLDHYDIGLGGLHAVVIGRSPVLGKPMAAMLLNRDATVTVCHSKTRDLPALVARADLVVAAVGKPEFVRGKWIKQGAVVVDAGFHPPGVGDVELSAAIPRCSAYTPVPGGVGPMTIATLIAQTVEAAERRFPRQA